MGYNIGRANPSWKGGKIKKFCLICGREYLARRNKVETSKFCSTKCYAKWRSENLRGERSPGWRGGDVRKVCEFCGKEFYARKDSSNRQRGKFCSDICKRKARITRVQKNCRTCGREFFAVPAVLKIGEGKFCSKSCAAIWNRAHNKKKFTFIETVVKSYLDKIGIEYEEQKMIPEGHTVADFYIPEQRLVLYADGTYWHSLPGVPRKDATQELTLGLHGFKVLRLKEPAIKNGAFKNILKKEIVKGGFPWNSST